MYPGEEGEGPGEGPGLFWGQLLGADWPSRKVSLTTALQGAAREKGLFKWM